MGLSWSLYSLGIAVFLLLMQTLVITGTGTEVGKTVVTAAIAALGIGCGKRVAVLKPAQTGVQPGESGDIDEVRRLARPLTTHELRRYPDPLSPEAAARQAGQTALSATEIISDAESLANEHDLLLIEGAGGLLVRFDSVGSTIAEVAQKLRVPVVLVVDPGLGTLNTTALTAEALARRGVELLGLVIGRWPTKPDLATRCNLIDLPVVAGAPLLGVLPEGVPGLSHAEFKSMAWQSLSPALGGEFDSHAFTSQYIAAQKHNYLSSSLSG